ncbi:RDD family protein [Arthrobacter sp. ISL-30]|uniref:RDD family protein n=1 Tax=Arthrobacter sp. ISL-30 TaxID=2819109 RepID=UPI001BE9C79E|nr:RDD family protein [Arthrobacter sp. ISL-30]MBT2514032.1 RDD family protein [Arthrobacter sp. ISL-30]
MSSIITGEAVVLELRPASFGSRALGLILDVLTSVAVLIGLLILIDSASGSLDEAALRALVLVSVVFSFVVLPVAVETLSRGRSLGKLATGLRIVRDDGGSIRFRHAVIRGLIGFVEIYLTFGGLAIAVALFNDKCKRLGDIAAGTYSLRQRVPSRPLVLAVVPPYLQPWVSLADFGRIPDGVARRATQFIQQSSRMAPVSRAGMAATLASELSAYVAPPPPPGTTPEDYLWAVLGERRRRDFERLKQAEARNARLGERLNRLPFS